MFQQSVSAMCVVPLTGLIQKTVPFVERIFRAGKLKRLRNPHNSKQRSCHLPPPLGTCARVFPTESLVLLAAAVEKFLLAKYSRSFATGGMVQKIPKYFVSHI